MHVGSSSIEQHTVALVHERIVLIDTSAAQQRSVEWMDAEYCTHESSIDRSVLEFVVEGNFEVCEPAESHFR